MTWGMYGRAPPRTHPGPTPRAPRTSERAFGIKATEAGSGWGATTCILLLVVGAAAQLECKWCQNPISRVSSDTHALPDAFNRLVHQLWGFAAAGLVCI
jgi:hypothetical protein